MKYKTKVQSNSKLGEIVKLINSHFPEWGASIKLLRQYIEGGGKVLYLERRGKVVAYAIIRKTDFLYELMLVGVVKEHRGKGLGTQLVKKVLKLVESKGGFFSTYASIYNTPSINMLIKCGLKVEYCTTRWIFFNVP